MNQQGSAVVTGCAGFLGSHLCQALLASGHAVTGIDCFTSFYARPLKERNIAPLSRSPGFRLVEADIAEAPLAPLLEGVDFVYHLAAQAGVRTSFGDGFRDYLHHNVQGTQRLLEEVAGREVRSFVYASSSSVYGDQEEYPVTEDAPLRPLSPYGATKVITEQLAQAFWHSHGVPTVGLRYFTVYGPRQRPDMAFSRFLSRAIGGQPLPIIGDGRQVREFTYVDDVVAATLAAAASGERGAVYNIGGGQAVSVLDAVGLLEKILDRPLKIEHLDGVRGDPRRTEADITRAKQDLDYVPATPLADGLAAHLEALRDPQSVEVGA